MKVDDVTRLDEWVAAGVDGEKREAAPAVAPTPPTPMRPRLYSPDRRGYLRATVEEGTRAEIDGMRAEATGSPFFSAPSASHVPSEGSAADSLAARLASLASSRKTS